MQRTGANRFDYIDTDAPSLLDIFNLTDTPLNRLTEHQIRPPRESIDSDQCDDVLRSRYPSPGRSEDQKNTRHSLGLPGVLFNGHKG